MDIFQQQYGTTDMSPTNRLLFFMSLFAVTLPGAAIVIIFDYTFYNAVMESPKIGGVTDTTVWPAMLYSGSYLVGFLFGLSCVIVRQAGLALFCQRMAESSGGSGHLTKLRRGIIGFVYSLALGEGCIFLSSYFRCLVWWCMLMGVLPIVWMAIYLSRKKDRMIKLSRNAK